MKLPVLLLALLFAAMNISVPSSLMEMEGFTSDTMVVSSNDLADTSEEEREEADNTPYEIEETDFYSSFPPPHLETHSKPFHILSKLKVFIPSYSFSIFIPPLS